MKIVEDFRAYAGKSIGKGISTILFNPCFHSIVLFRLSCALYNIHLTPLAKIVWYVNRVAFNVDLDYRAKIAGGFRLIHGLGVVIGCEVIAGKNLTVYQGVTLGGNQGKRRILCGLETGQPYIEEGATIYTDAKVFGPVLIPTGGCVKAGRIATKDSDVSVR